MIDRYIPTRIAGFEASLQYLLFCYKKVSSLSQFNNLKSITNFMSRVERRGDNDIRWFALSLFD